MCPNNDFLLSFPFASEPRTQTSDRSVCHDGNGGTGGVGGFSDDRPQAAVVHHRRGAGPAGPTQTHPKGLPATAEAFETFLSYHA